MINTKFSSWPLFSEEEANAVKNVLLSNKVNYWTGGQCRDFELEFARFCNTGYAISIANGTLALDLALKSLDIKLGDEVIVTSRTFIASVSTIINIGAIPIFADVDLNVCILFETKQNKSCRTYMCCHFTWKNIIVCGF